MDARQTPSLAAGGGWGRERHRLKHGNRTSGLHLFSRLLPSCSGFSLFLLAEPLDLQTFSQKVHQKISVSEPPPLLSCFSVRRLSSYWRHCSWYSYWQPHVNVLQGSQAALPLLIVLFAAFELEGREQRKERFGKINLVLEMLVCQSKDTVQAGGVGGEL